ncbi:pyridoxamine 5'-phosphate oxidase [Streptomyces sp. NPDC054786]
MAEMSDTEDAGGSAGLDGAAGARGAAGPVGAAESGAAAGVGGTPCPEGIRRALAAHTTMTLAYVDEEGPQACAVLYAADTVGAGHASDAAGAVDTVHAAGATRATGAADAADATNATDAADAQGGTAVGAGPALYFVTAATTRHGRALAEPGARVAFTAQRDGQEWSGLTGLQGRGRCRALTGAERAAGWRVYLERFPFVAASDRLRDALERTALWELRPDWLRLIDNGQGFGHKEEWSGP